MRAAVRLTSLSIALPPPSMLSVLPPAILFPLSLRLSLLPHPKTEVELLILPVPLLFFHRDPSHLRQPLLHLPVYSSCQFWPAISPFESGVETPSPAESLLLPPLSR